MALPSEQYDGLLERYRARVDSYPGVDARYGTAWREWCRALVSFGGSLVVPPGSPEPDLEALLAEGVLFESAVRGIPGDLGECHRNVARLWIDGAVASIGTGYALSDDELWRQHSWGFDADGTVVETTDSRLAYAGISLPPRARSIRFAGSNAPEQLKAALRQGGPRSAELIGMMRELAGEGG